MPDENDNILYQAGASPESAVYYLDRPKVRALLEDAVKRPLTTVTAGAGYGKTQAVYSLLGAPGRDSVWLQLSVLDNHVYRFWERFAYGFGRYNPKLGGSLKSLGFPETEAAFDKFLRLFAAGLDHKKNTVLILDDFHLIYQNAALVFLEKLILARVKNFSVILVSRKKLDIDSAALLSKGLLSRVTEDDLRFTKEEVFAYYEGQGLEIDEEAAAKIHYYTEGWIFAIYLIGLSLKKGRGSKADPLALAREDIYGLIEKELFSAAEPKLRKTLVRASLPDFLSKGILELIAAGDGIDASALISGTPGLDQFIRYDPFSGGYRIHHLFREFLRGQRHILDSAEITQTHYTAAKWYEQNGFFADAAEHYKKCGRYGEIFGMILSFRRQCPQETADTVIKLIDGAPRELLEAKPVMQVVKSYYLLNNNKIDAARALLEGMRQKYEALPLTENRALLGEIYIALGLISKIRQDYEFEELFKKADEFLPGGSALIGQDFNIAEGINITGIKDPSAGELQKHCDAMFRAMPCAARVMNGCNYGAEYLNAADACFMTGDIAGAEKNAFEAAFRARSKKQYGIVCMAEYFLIRIYVLKGDYASAAAILKQMKQRQDSGSDTGSIPLYDIIEGWFYVKLGETGKVRKWIRRGADESGRLPPVLIGREYLVRSDSLLAEDRCGELLALMAYTDTVYAERGILYAVIQNEITKAIIYHYTGDHAASIKALNGAWRLSDPNNLIIQYVEYGNRMRTLISAAKKNPDCVIPQNWLDSIYKKSSSYAKQLANAVNDYRKKHAPKKSAALYAGLSGREREVLQFLCRGMTRKEIADACYLSPNTVKSILQSVYSKLGAANNADAVHIAATLGLIEK